MSKPQKTSCIKFGRQKWSHSHIVYVRKVIAGFQALLPLTCLSDADLAYWAGSIIGPIAPLVLTGSCFSNSNSWANVHLPPRWRTLSSAGHSHHWGWRFAGSEDWCRFQHIVLTLGSINTHKDNSLTDCETSPHNCIRSNPYSKSLVSGSAFLIEPWLVQQAIIESLLRVRLSAKVFTYIILFDPHTK